MFNYQEAFSRNIGWVTKAEQQILRGKKCAIAGLGGVGGDHAIVLARLGVGNFHIADMDRFDVANFNRQAGANMSTVGKTKVEVLSETLEKINPESRLQCFTAGVNAENLEDFLDGVDVYVDSLDLFCIDIRRAIFQRCYEKGIPAITAAPIGMGTALLVFMPGKMSFEEYFCMEGKSFDDQILHFICGLSPKGQQASYLVDKSAINITARKVPSTCMGISMAAGVLCTNVLKLLLQRGDVVTAPHGLQFDAYRNSLVKSWRPWGNRNPLQRLRISIVKRLLAKQALSVVAQPASA